jgi:hypothetical protein
VQPLPLPRMRRRPLLPCTALWLVILHTAVANAAAHHPAPRHPDLAKLLAPDALVPGGLPTEQPRTIRILPRCFATAARPPDATRGRGHPSGGSKTRRGGQLDQWRRRGHSCEDGAAAPSASRPSKARRAGPNGQPPWRQRRRGRAVAVMMGRARRSCEGKQQWRHRWRWRQGRRRWRRRWRKWRR